MPSTSTIPITYSTGASGLVSVDGRTYPLKSARIAAHAEGGVASTTFTQTYTNPYAEPLEVLYTLPLPANGAVIGYTVRLGKRVIHGEVRRREEARREYQNALIEGRPAALLEQDRADTFTQKLGSLPPGEAAEVEIDVLQTLFFLPGEGKEQPRWEYRFPTVVGIRYEGGEGRVPDAARLDVDRAGGEGIPARLDASLFVADGPVERVQPNSPGHEITAANVDNGVRVVLSEKARLDRDLVVRWNAAQQEVGVRFVEGKGLPCDDGRYVLITLTPPCAVERGFHRDLTVLIDASGSMSGTPLNRAKIVVEQLLRSLDPGDRFEILAFANDVRRLVLKPVEAGTLSVRDAIAKLDELQAGGSTEMTRAIVEALKPLRSDSQRQVVLVSDGYIGFEGEVIGEVMRRLAPGARLHVVGVGSAPNRTLTRGAARAGRGIEILVGDNDDACAASRRLLQATVRPVLTDLEIKGPALVSVVPERPQDVLTGQPIILIAETTGVGGWLEIHARQAGSPQAWIRRVEIPAGAHEADGCTKPAMTPLPVGALFGRGAIEDLELLLAASGRGEETEALELRIENLGLRHGIASRRTSLVAISEDPTLDPKDPRRRERLAVELPAEVSAEGVGLMPAAMPMDSGVFSQLSMAWDHTVGEASPPMAPRYVMQTQVFSRRTSVKPTILGRLGFSARKPPEVRLDLAKARVLRLEGPILVLEFEVPEEGFLLPNDKAKVQVRFDDGSTGDARVQGDRSTKPGPHKAGVTVRLALKLEDHSVWESGGARLTWRQKNGREVDLHITVGPSKGSES
ncbi:MAG TPA: VIT domain-containing protein [Acidobacteriota bacterium]|nr:VIT domain-containing protein [Acidobacteriota bacterium]